MQSDSLRELYLVRHAKTDWDAAFTDGERPLSTKGKKQAACLGDLITEKKIKVDVAYISDDLRAKQTFRRLKLSNEILQVTAQLKETSQQKLLKFLAEIPRKHNKVLIIGHDPELQELIEYLQDQDSCQDCDSHLFPAGALAHFILPNDWQNLQASTGKLVQIIRPKKHPTA